MVRVMVVEDEPAAMRYIMQLLNTRCDGIEIVGQAEDGKDAIEVLKDTQVDIVITDIQMKSMNGIELARWLNRNRPDTYTLIISGYSDFEYAKDAISAGVVEYLLKPVRPAEFAAVMKKLISNARQRKREAREKWLIQALTSSSDSPRSPWLWPQGNLLLGVVRLGGVYEDARLTSWLFPYTPDLPEELSAVYVLDESLICFAVPFCGGTDPEVLAAALSRDAPYYTALYKEVLPSDENFSWLSDMLDVSLKIAILGKKQTVVFISVSPEEPEPSTKEQTLIRNLRYVISNSQLDKIKTGLTSLFDFWESEDFRLSHVSLELGHLLQQMANYAPAGGDGMRNNPAEFTNSICRQASDFLDLMRMTWTYCEQIYKPIARSGRSGQLATAIEDYIHGHLSEPLSTQQICNVFRISGSYLSQLFRQFVKMPFVEYVKQRRVDEAKRLMIEFPDMSIKVIAAQLGFSDQFYFSKVFRSIIGVSPSEFRTR